MARSLDLFSHLGGLKTNVSPFLYNSADTPNSLNVDYDTELGSVTNSLQYALHANDAGNNAIQGVFPFEDEDGTRKLFMASNGVIYEDASGTWTSRKTGLDTSAKYDSVMYFDNIFVANGVDNMQYSSDGTTWNAASGQTPKYVEVYRDRLYTAGFSSAAANDFKLSNVGDGTTVSQTEGIAEVVTGIKTALNYLWVFAENAVYRWDESNLVRVDNFGTTSNRSLAAGDNALFFANRDGVYQTSGAKAQLISRPVQYWWDGITASNFASLNGAYHKFEYYLWIGDSQGQSDVVLVYNTLYQTWRVLTGIPSNVMATWVNTSSESNLYFGNNTADSLVYKFQSVYTQAGTTVSCQYDYPILYPAKPDKEFYGKGLTCFAESAGNVVFQIQYALDWSTSFKTLDTWMLEGRGFPESKKIDVPNRLSGHAVQWRILVENSTNKWHWHGMKFWYEQRPGRTD